MIALVSTSQVKYTSDKGDSLVCYTHLENRAIAKVFLEGERDHALLTNCEFRVETLQAIDTSRLKQIEQLNKQNEALDESYLNCFEQVTIKDKTARRLKTQLVIGKILIIGLIIK